MLDQGQDQAAGLRRRMGRPALNLMAFPLLERDSHGSAWVGQVARTLHSLGSRALVVDASGGEVARALGVARPARELMDLLTGRLPFDAVAQVTREGVHVIRADAGLDAFVAQGGVPQDLLRGFADLSHAFDVLLLAMPAGELACLTSPAQTVPVMVADAGPEGVKRAYATIKQLSAEFGYSQFALALRGAGGQSEALAVHARMAQAARTFLNAGVTLAGWIPAATVSGTDMQSALQRLVQTLLDHASTPVLRH
ncbi:MAG: hypothetical protein V4562_01960 [Pseudomonadota bacterium]